MRGKDTARGIYVLFIQHAGEENEEHIKEGESRTHLKLPTGMYPKNNTVSSLKVMHCKKYFDE
jgi:hypothetical protein